jgi:hypothetical protein
MEDTTTTNTHGVTGATEGQAKENVSDNGNDAADSLAPSSSIATTSKD